MFNFKCYKCQIDWAIIGEANRNMANKPNQISAWSWPTTESAMKLINLESH